MKEIFLVHITSRDSFSRIDNCLKKTVGRNNYLVYVITCDKPTVVAVCGFRLTDIIIFQLTRNINQQYRFELQLYGEFW